MRVGDMFQDFATEDKIERPGVVPAAMAENFMSNWNMQDVLADACIFSRINSVGVPAKHPTRKIHRIAEATADIEEGSHFQVPRHRHKWTDHRVNAGPQLSVEFRMHLRMFVQMIARRIEGVWKQAPAAWTHEELKDRRIAERVRNLDDRVLCGDIRTNGARRTRLPRLVPNQFP